MSYPYEFLLETSLMVRDLDEAVEHFGANFGIWPRADLPIWDISESGAKLHSARSVIRAAPRRSSPSSSRSTKCTGSAGK